MKKLFTILFLVHTANYLSSQTGIIQYNYKIGYTEPESRAQLLFNNFESMYFAYKLKTPSDDIKDENVNKILNTSIEPSDSSGTIVYRNFNTQNLKIKNLKKNSLDKNYIVQDLWTEIDWQIFDSTKNILNYNCQLAKGYYRGRTYITWFTDSIALPIGPWKIFGLPGAILECYVLNEPSIYFKAINVEYSLHNESNFKIYEPFDKLVIDIKKLKKYEEQRNESIMNALNSSIGRAYRIESIKINKPKDQILELKYEWE